MKHTIWNNLKVKHQTLQISLSLLLLFVSNCTCNKLPVQDGKNNSNNIESTDNQEKPPVKRGLGGGIAQIGNSCYMNATLQIFKAVYPKVFDGKSDPISQAGQKIMEALDKEAGVSQEVAKSFFKALQDHLSAGWPAKDGQEDASELLTALFDKLQFPKAIREVKLTHPTTGNTRWLEGKDPWDILQIPIDSVQKSMQHLFDASLQEGTLDDDAKWESSDPNPTPGIKNRGFLSGLNKLKENTLVIHIKRFENNLTKISTIVQDPFHLVIKKEQIVEKERTRDLNYELVGFIVHYGSYGGGHYVAYAKKDDQWVLYNDSSASVPSEQSLKTEAEKAYIYFYKPVGPQAA